MGPLWKGPIKELHFIKDLKTNGGSKLFLSLLYLDVYIFSS